MVSKNEDWKENEWRVLSVKQMLDDGLKNNRSHKYQIPMTEPVDFSEKEFQVNPYEFGFNILADSEKQKRLAFTN